MCMLKFSHMNFLEMVKVTAMIKLIKVTVIDAPMRGKCEQQDGFGLAQLKSQKRTIESFNKQQIKTYSNNSGENT